MTPTHLYAKVVLSLVQDAKLAPGLKAVANVTGGGMENLPRVMPKGTVLPLIDWAWPEPFVVVQDRTGMSRIEMLKTLNCGIGLALVVSKPMASAIEAHVRSHGYEVYSLGTIEAAGDAASEPEVRY